MVISFKTRRNISGTIIYLIIIMLTGWLLRNVLFIRNEESLPVGSHVFNPPNINIFNINWREILLVGIPGLEEVYEQASPVKVTPQVTKWQIMRDAIIFFSRY